MKQRNLRALETFEAVSRHRSLTAAAQELGVTQSAVSHQIKRLSEQIGETLLRRAGKRVELTPRGEQLALSLRQAFSQIDSSVDQALGSNRTTIRIAVCSSFAPGWLIRRLANFYAACPGVDLQLRMYAKDPELTDDVADAFVTTLPTVRGFFALRLRRELLIAVRRPMRQDSEPLPLITTTLPPKEVGGDWKEFCRLAGAVLEELHNGTWLQATHYVLAYEMALEGLGNALVPDFLAAGAISSGMLEQRFGTAMPTEEDYFLCIKSARRGEAGLRMVEAWFRSQVGGSIMTSAHD